MEGRLSYSFLDRVALVSRASAVIIALLMKGTYSRLTFALQADTGAGDTPRLLLLLRFREAQCWDRSISSRQVTGHKCQPLAWIECVWDVCLPLNICVCIHPPHATCKSVCLLVYMNLWGHIYLCKNVLCACECVTLVLCPACFQHVWTCVYMYVWKYSMWMYLGAVNSLINTKSRENIMTHSEWAQTHPSVSDHQSSSIQQCLLIGDYPSDECQWLRGFNLCQPQ